MNAKRMIVARLEEDEDGTYKNHEPLGYEPGAQGERMERFKVDTRYFTSVPPVGRQTDEAWKPSRLFLLQVDRRGQRSQTPVIPDRQSGIRGPGQKGLEGKARP